MRILFDSHALVWFLLGDRRFSEPLREVVKESEIFVSAVCAWELAAKGKWLEAATIIATLDELLEANAYTPLPITIQHAVAAGYLPGRHRDPFDRMLAAQSRLEGLTLLSADPAFRELGARVVW